MRPIASQGKPNSRKRERGIDERLKHERAKLGSYVLFPSECSCAHVEIEKNIADIQIGDEVVGYKTGKKEQRTSTGQQRYHLGIRKGLGEGEAKRVGCP